QPSINHRGDILNTPTIAIGCASPSPDVLLPAAYHWKAQTKTTNGPHLEASPDIDVNEFSPGRQDSLVATKTDTGLKLSTNTLRATVNTRPHVFTIDIKSHGVSNLDNPSSAHELLTQLGRRSVGYVKRGTTAGHPNATPDDPDPGERWVTL
ncbi:hypothetical protein FISHEDRAFT_70806, partial [Fistulina hepatica ATCC 64428]